MRRNQYLNSPLSEHTKRSYRQAVEHFEMEWGGMLPTTDEHLARYLVEFADFHRLTTLRLRLYALSRWHREQGFYDPTQSPLVQTTYEQLKQRLGQSSRRSQPVTIETLLTLDRWFDRQLQREDLKQTARSKRLIRDRALLYLAFWGLPNGEAIQAIQINQVAVIAGHGLLIERSNDKDETGSLSSLQLKLPALRRCCPVGACADWIALLESTYNAPQGPLIRPISYWGGISSVAMSKKSSLPVLRRLFINAGVQVPEPFRWCSFKRNFISPQPSATPSTKELMEQVGFRNRRTALDYL